jgi:small subunit ribosomal protein S16
MLMIRLSRAGRTNLPHYSIVVTEKSNPASDGNFLEKVGVYTPTGKTPVFKFEKERIEYWISKGAHPTETLARLLHKQGLKGMDRFVDLKKKFQIKSGKEASAAAPAAPAAPAEPAAA